MARRMLHISLPASAFAAALLIGTAPAAWAQCAVGAAGSMVQDMTTTSQSGTGQSGTGQSGAGQSGAGTTAEQSGSATAAAEGGVQTDQGGITTGESGEKTAQTGGSTAQAGGNTATGGQGAATGGGGDTAMAAVDSPDIEGPDEERVKSLLEEQGYTQVSSIYSCGAYYEAQAMQDGQEETVMVDLATGRITSQQQSQQQ